MQKPSEIKIKIKNYEEETEELKDIFKNLGLREFDSLDFQFKNIPEGEYTVETKHMFGNQYNTREGYRIFEKCTKLFTHRNGKGNGYYIAEGIHKIREVQSHITVCHYCGAQYWDSNLTWCTSCRGSEYLTIKYYHLLKLTNIHKKCAPATTTIPEDVLLDIEKQKNETIKKNMEKYIKNRFNDLEKKKKEIEKEEEGLKIFVSKGINIDNLIYYGHKDTFCFGWMKALSENKKNELKNKLADVNLKIEYK